MEFIEYDVWTEVANYLCTNENAGFLYYFPVLPSNDECECKINPFWMIIWTVRHENTYIILLFTQHDKPTTCV